MSIYMLLVVVVILRPAVSSFVAYECNTTDLKYKAYSLVDLPKCALPQIEISAEKKLASVYIAPQYLPIHVYSCKVKIHRTVSFCRWIGAASPVKNGDITYYYGLSRDNCMDLQTGRSISSLELYGVSDVPNNATTLYRRTLSGSLTVNGRCNGGKFSDQFETYDDDVITSAETEVTLSDYTAKLDIETNNIILQDGTVCRTSASKCLTRDQETIVWKDYDTYACEDKSLKHILTGDAYLIHSSNTSLLGGRTDYYKVKSHDRSMVIPISSDIIMCAHEFKKSSLEGVIVSFTYHKSDLTKGKRSEYDMLYHQLESKIISISVETEKAFTQLYTTMILNDCMLERQAVAQLTTLGYSDPLAFALTLYKDKGYTAVKAGDAVYIAKCQPVDVTIRDSPNCYEHVPVVFREKEMFVNTRNMLLVDSSVVVPCSKIFSSLMKLPSGWHAVGSSSGKREPPEIVDLGVHKDSYIPQILENINDGLYSEKDIKEANTRMLYPYMKESVEGNIANHIIFGEINYPNMNMKNLIPESMWDDIITRSAKKIWGWAHVVGDLCTGILGIWVIAKLLMYIINSAMNMLTLYDAFGLSWKMLGSFIDGFVTYVIHKDHKRKPDPQDVELGGVVSSQYGPDKPGNKAESNSENVSGKSYIPLYPTTIP